MRKDYFIYIIIMNSVIKHSLSCLALHVKLHVYCIAFREDHILDMTHLTLYHVYSHYDFYISFLNNFHQNMHNFILNNMNNVLCIVSPLTNFV